MNSFGRFRDAALVAAFIAVPFFFLKSNLTSPENATLVDGFLLKASAPVQYVATSVADGVSRVIEEYVWLVDVGRTNRTLRHENDRLRQEVRDLRWEALENRRLRDLLALRNQFGGDSLSARVIGKEVSPLFRVNRLRLDRGERDLDRGMAVVSARGLVGQILRTSGRYSDVLLTVDRTSAIDVVIQRTGARGMLRGTGEDDRYLCRIQYLRRDEEVDVGDEVYTSGLGQRFPASILVGTVTSVRRQDFGLYQEAEVSPAVDFSTLEEVLVLTEGSREQTVVGSVSELNR